MRKCFAGVSLAALMYAATLGFVRTPTALGAPEEKAASKPKSGPGKGGEKKPQTARGIYKLDGGTLTLALGMADDAPRPTEFKASAPGPDGKGAVVVVTLKKK